MDFPCCPICSLPVPAPELQRHANRHLDEDQVSTDLELAKQLALAASPSPINSRVNYLADVQFEYDPRLYDYEYDPTPAAIPSSSTTTSRFEGNKDTVEAWGIDEQVCRAVELQCRTSFHKIEGGLMALLKKCLESESQYSKCMLSGYIDHFESSMYEDAGWGCGWRNIQMASSHLMHRPEAKEVLFGGCGYVPDIASLQRWMEVAWGKGFDAVGSSHFGGRIYGTNKWIGTTECAGLFRSFGLRARVVDFDGKGNAKKACRAYGPMDKFVTRRVNNAGNHHKCDDSLAKESVGYQALVDWVWNYFSDHIPSHCVKQRVCVTNKMPLYFQHAGHSRTIVGIQVNHQKNGVKHYNLLVLDPGHKTIALEKSLKANAGWQPLIKRGIHTLRKPQYQLCYVDCGIACGMELEQLKTIESVLIEV